MIEALTIVGSICSIIGVAWPIARYILRKRKEKSEPSADTEAR